MSKWESGFIRGPAKPETHGSIPVFDYPAFLAKIMIIMPPRKAAMPIMWIWPPLKEAIDISMKNP